MKMICIFVKETIGNRSHLFQKQGSHMMRKLVEAGLW